VSLCDTKGAFVSQKKRVSPGCVFQRPNGTEVCVHPGLTAHLDFRVRTRIRKRTMPRQVCNPTPLRNIIKPKCFVCFVSRIHAAHLSCPRFKLHPRYTNARAQEFIYTKHHIQYHLLPMHSQTINRSLLVSRKPTRTVFLFLKGKPPPP